MENKNTRGSEWRKWDLHIHSNASDGEASPAEIVAEAKRKGISAIALTDHHTAKNIDEIRAIGEKEGVYIIAGIEFRSELGGKSVHFIGLFPEMYDKTLLNTKALTELIISPLKISETTIIAKGAEKNASLSEDQAFKAGMFLVQVDFIEAAKLIHSYGGLICVHNGTKDNGLDAEVKHKGNSPRNVKELYDCLGTLKEELLKDHIDICEIRKENDDEEFYLKTFNKPSIIASDAHKLKDIGTKPVWIKADLSFEGLRQIIFEPAERVLISEDVPEQINDYQLIDSISIKSPDFGEQHIPLNPNLNTIIGGRSSGKSILLGCIAKKIGTTKRVKENNDEYEEYMNSLIPFVSIKWKDDIMVTNRDIEYFPQSYINGLAMKSDELNKLVENIIKNDLDKKIDLEKFHSFCIDNKSKINEEIAAYFDLKEKVKVIETEISSIGNKEGIQKQVQKIWDELLKVKLTMKSELTEADDLFYQENIKRISILELDTENFKKTINQLELIKNANIVSDISADFTGILDNIKSKLLTRFSTLREEFIKNWKEEIQLNINEIKHTIDNNNIAITAINENPVFIKCKEYFNQNKLFIEHDKRLKIEENKLKAIDEYEKESHRIKNDIESKSKSIISLHNEFYQVTLDLIKKLQFENGDVKISAYTNFDEKDFQNQISSCFDLRNQETKTMVDYKFQSIERHLDFISSIFNKIIENKVSLKNSFAQQQVIINLFASNFFKIEYNISFEGDNLESMSEGKKAFIILRILLDFNHKQCPILIDQPEDDLDNRAIYYQLVHYLRKKKKERQIILVTHSPNIVVGADAEEVIVANQHGIKSINQDNTKFEYLSGSLENNYEKITSFPLLISQGIKQHVCEVLEGGNEAFRKRELKYGVKK